MDEKNKPNVSDLLTNLLSVMGDGFTKVEHNFKSVKAQVDALKNRLDLLQKAVEDLKGTTTDGLGDVGVKIENLTEEISKISIVTKYSEQFKNLQGFN